MVVDPNRSLAHVRTRMDASVHLTEIASTHALALTDVAESVEEYVTVIGTSKCRAEQAIKTSRSPTSSSRTNSTIISNSPSSRVSSIIIHNIQIIICSRSSIDPNAVSCRGTMCVMWLVHRVISRRIAMVVMPPDRQGVVQLVSNGESNRAAFHAA